MENKNNTPKTKADKKNIVRDFIEDQSFPMKKLVRAVALQLGFSDLSSEAQASEFYDEMDSFKNPTDGWSGFIYTDECLRFTQMHFTLICECIEEFCDDLDDDHGAISVYQDFCKRHYPWGCGFENLATFALSIVADTFQVFIEK